jgi:hypothetical protein
MARVNLNRRVKDETAMKQPNGFRLWKLIAVILVLPTLVPLARFIGSAQQPERSAAQRGGPVYPHTGPLELDTSDANLGAAFGWARRQALAYAFSGDPVGDWYEAALPGREAFCMRDVSHQSMGAHALGLAHSTRNMLGKFAENISDAKDWCSYWEINRDNRPAPVDYHDDAEFWYNLPANFDVLDACYRMYVWTGDRAYLTEPSFLNFYKRTAHDYVDRWDLGLDRIMTRQRIMNVRGRLDPAHRFQKNRGIPSYEEGDPNFVVAVDQVAVQYAGYLAYARFEQLLGNEEESREFLKRANEVKLFLNQVWWDNDSGNYYSTLSVDHKLASHALNLSVLYYGAAEEGPKSDAAVNAILRSIADKAPMGIEEQSHLPEILYRQGRWDAAYDQILDLTREGKNRREYPEVSYSVIGAIVTGLMGIELIPAEPEKALEESLYVDRTVTTLSHLTSRTKWVELRHVPVRTNDLRVRHDGLNKTTLVNLGGPSLVWRTCFQGRHSKLLINDKAVDAAPAIPARNGQPLSCTTVTVGSGESKTAQTAE